MRAVFEVVKPGIDALAALATYQAKKGLLAAVQNFSLDLFDVIDELAFLARRFDEEGIVLAAYISGAMRQPGTQGQMTFKKAGPSSSIAFLSLLERSTGWWMDA